MSKIISLIEDKVLITFSYNFFLKGVVESMKKAYKKTTAKVVDTRIAMGTCCTANTYKTQ